MSKDTKTETKEAPLQLLGSAQLSNVRRYAEFDVPMVEGYRVRVRSLTESEQSRFEASQIKKNGNPNKAAIEASRRKYICLCLVNDENDPYMTPNELREVDSRLVNFLFSACAEHNGLNDRDQDALLGN